MMSLKPSKSYQITVYTHTNVTSNVNQWIEEMNKIITNDLGYDVSIKSHQKWWNKFWHRSWIQILPSSSIGEEASTNLTQMYYLQRWMDACSGRGNYTIKFNGLIFTVDVILDGYHTDPDYRTWGGAYWFQNTRQPYWTFLSSGDFDMALPFYKMYTDALLLAKERTRVFFGHSGAFFPETSYFFGSYTNEDYGCNRSGKALWWVDSPWERYHYNGGIELVTLMLEYYSYTQDINFLHKYLFPMADAIMNFWVEHYPPSLQGIIILTPAQAIETFQEAINPLPDIAGLRWNLELLLKLPNLTNSRSQIWTYLLNNLPPIPTTVDNSSHVRLTPAEVFFKDN